MKEENGDWKKPQGNGLNTCPGGMTKENGWTLLKTGLMAFFAYRTSMLPFKPEHAQTIAKIVKHAPCIKGTAWLAGCINLPLSFIF